MTAPWLAPWAARLADLAPLAPMARLAVLDTWARESAVCTESGRALRFVPADRSGAAAAADAPALAAYESRIFASGEVATRIDGPGARHDLYNALAWLAFPRAKARLNALHAQALGPMPLATLPTPPGTTPVTTPAQHRGRLRDAATLFDENAALWIGLDPSLEAALRAFDWHRLFVVERARLARSVRVRVFGHALLEKLDAPFKGITAHAWPLRMPPDASPAELDAALAASLVPQAMSSRLFCPLPVMGLPGWCEANRDPAFYNDPAVFRPGRRRPGVGPRDRSDQD
jgi:hypothetical protein